MDHTSLKTSGPDLQLALPLLITILLIFFTLIFTSRAFKQLIHIQTSIDAIFSNIDLSYIAAFNIKKPLEIIRKSKRHELLNTQYNKLLHEIFNSFDVQASFLFQLKRNFRTYNNLIYWMVKSTITSVNCCGKKKKKEFTFVEAKGYIHTLIYQLNILISWICVSLSIAIVTFISDNISQRVLIQILIAINAPLSCGFGLAIAYYINHIYQTNLIGQISNVFYFSYQKNENQQEANDEQNNQQSYYQIQPLIIQKQASLNKLFGFIIFLSLSFGVCIYIMMTLTYDHKIALIVVFLISNGLDLLGLRNVLLIIASLIKAIKYKIQQKKEGVLERYFNSGNARLSEGVGNSISSKSMMHPDLNSASKLQQLNNSTLLKSHQKSKSNQQQMSSAVYQASNQNLLSDSKNDTLFQCEKIDDLEKSTYDSNQPNLTNVFKSLVLHYKDQDLYNNNFLENETLLSSKDLKLLDFQQTKRIYELVMLSFTEQTYGAKAAVKILRKFKRGQNFDLIDKIKEKVFQPIYEVDKVKLNLISPNKALTTSFQNEDLQVEKLQESLSKSFIGINLEEKFSEIGKLDTVLEVNEDLENTQKFLSRLTAKKIKDLYQRIDKIGEEEKEEEEIEEVKLNDRFNQSTHSSNLGRKQSERNSQNFNKTQFIKQLMQDEDAQNKDQINDLEDIENPKRPHRSELPPIASYQFVTENERTVITRENNTSADLMPKDIDDEDHIQLPSAREQQDTQEDFFKVMFYQKKNETEEIAEIKGDTLPILEPNRQYTKFEKEINIDEIPEVDSVKNDSQNNKEQSPFKEITNLKRQEDESASEIQIGGRKRKGAGNKKGKKKKNVQKENQENNNAQRQSSSPLKYQYQSIEVERFEDKPEQNQIESNEVVPQVYNIQSYTSREQHEDKAEELIPIVDQRITLQNTQPMVINPLEEEGNQLDNSFNQLEDYLNKEASSYHFQDTQRNQNQLILQSNSSFNNLCPSESGADIGLKSFNDTSNSHMEQQTKTSFEGYVPLNQKQIIKNSSHKKQKKEQERKNSPEQEVAPLTVRLLNAKERLRASSQEESTRNAVGQGIGKLGKRKDNQLFVISGPESNPPKYLQQKPPLCKKNKDNLNGQQTHRSVTQSFGVESTRRQRPHRRVEKSQDIITLSSNNQNLQFIESGNSEIGQVITNDNRTDDEVTDAFSRNEPGETQQSFFIASNDQNNNNNIKMAVNDKNKIMSQAQIRKSFSNVNDYSTSQRQIEFYQPNANTLFGGLSSGGNPNAETGTTIQDYAEQNGRPKKFERSKTYEREQQYLNQHAPPQFLNKIQDRSHSQESQNQLKKFMKIQKNAQVGQHIDIQLSRKSYLKYSGLSQVNKTYIVEQLDQNSELSLAANDEKSSNGGKKSLKQISKYIQDLNNQDYYHNQNVIIE